MECEKAEKDTRYPEAGGPVGGRLIATVAVKTLGPEKGAMRSFDWLWRFLNCP